MTRLRQPQGIVFLGKKKGARLVVKESKGRTDLDHHNGVCESVERKGGKRTNKNDLCIYCTDQTGMKLPADKTQGERIKKPG